jgi:hypothetical protein
MSSPRRVRPPGAAAAGGLLFVGLCMVLASLSSGAPAGAEAEARTHTLFMGADFDVQSNKVFHRVQDVSGGSFVIKVNGEEVLVPMNQAPVEFRIQQSLKLTENSATIGDLKGERAYSPANDPVKKFVREQPGGATHLQSSQAAMGSTMAQRDLGIAKSSGSPANIVAQVQQQANSVSASYSSALSAEGSDFNNVGSYSAKLQEELAKKLFDAMDVTFEVASPQPLNSPYVVIVAQYRERDERPGIAHNWIYARTLEPIDSKPRKVRLLQGGLPPGFELLNFKLHLYDRGQELATNVADKRVPLTRDEAFLYLKIDYVSSHKEATLPPTAAMGKLPADLRSRLTSAQFAHTFFVKVSKDGLPGEVFLDEACAQKADDSYLLSVIRDIRFNPALDKGRAVDGVARLNFDSLTF